MCHYVTVPPSIDIVVSSCNSRTSRCCADVSRRVTEECEVWDYFVSSVSIGNMYEVYVIVKVLCSFVLGIFYFGAPSIERFRYGEGCYTRFIYFAAGTL